VSYDNFFVPYSLEAPLAKMTDAQAGRLLKAMLAYSKYGEIPNFADDMRLDSTWDLVKEKLDFGEKAKNADRLKKRLIGKISAAKVRGNTEAENEYRKRLNYLNECGAEAYYLEFPDNKENELQLTPVNACQQQLANQTKQNGNKPFPTITNKNEPFQTIQNAEYPTLNEFMDFVCQHGGEDRTQAAGHLYNGCMERGWKDTNGVVIADWQSWAIRQLQLTDK